MSSRYRKKPLAQFEHGTSCASAAAPRTPQPASGEPPAAGPACHASRSAAPSASPAPNSTACSVTPATPDPHEDSAPTGTLRAGLGR